MLRVRAWRPFFVSAALALGALGASPPPTKSVRISVHARNEPIVAVLARLATAYHLNFAFGDIHGSVNADLHDVPMDEALRSILRPLALDYRRDGSVIVVSPRVGSDGIAPPAAESAPTVVPLTIMPATRAAQLLQSLFPQATVRTAPGANAVIISASPNDVQTMKSLIAGLDVRDPASAAVEAIPLKTLSAAAVVERIRGMYPKATVTAASRNSIIVKALPADVAQIRGIVAALDAPVAATAVAAPAATEVVRVAQRPPRDVARSVAHQFPHVRVAVAGPTVVLTGTPEDVSRAKAVVSQIDVPPFSTRYTQIYRLKSIDAQSVADLIKRSFEDVAVTVDRDLNAISVQATAAVQQRIADAIAQLDTASVQGQQGAAPAFGGSAFELVPLQSVVPGQQQGGGTTATDIGTAVVQALQPTAPDLRITVASGSQQLIVSGSAATIRQAKDLIAALDVVPQSVVLDTEVLEVDSNSSKNLGLQIVSPAIGSTFSEVVPAPDPNGVASRMIALQPITRTGLSIQAQLNLLIQRGSARVLADPRITTLSGKTATIRAGDTLGILTTVGGGPGTITTSQLQTFQTGVTLDITPLVSSNGEITVALHPVVNSLSGILNGVPQISTRDAQTTVHLKDNETLVIGGLIQENGQRTENRIPVLGDLPLVGNLFKNVQTSNTRNELVIVVTPHVLGTGATSTIPQAAVPALPAPHLLPTLPPGTTLPTPRGAPQPRPQPAPPIAAPPTPTAREAAGVKPKASPLATSAVTPLATPTAFPNADVYTFGAPPPSTYAAPGDAVSIFYATFSPTTVHDGTPVTISVITSSNVRQVTIGPRASAVNLAQIAPGKWQAAYNFGGFGLPVDQTAIQLDVVASRTDGTSSTIRVPVNYIR